MNQFIFTEEPPKHWSELCTSHGDLFNSAEWHEVLSQGFGSKTLYGWNKRDSTGITITVFKAGPFRVGYIGFPVGGPVGSRIETPDEMMSLKKVHFPSALHAVRILASAFRDDLSLALPVQLNPETAIEMLDEWKPDVDRKLRQDMNKAGRSPIKVVDAADMISAERIFRIYKETVSRHRGNMRYNKSYFNALLDLSKVCEKLRCLVAILDDKIVGFEVVACHGETGYSLHGCTNPAFKRYSPSDLLTYEAITWAKQQGMKCYNLMASPIDQGSLVKYKEKWGGVTRQQKTYNLVLRPMQATMFNVFAGVYQGMNKYLRLN